MHYTNITASVAASLLATLTSIGCVLTDDDPDADGGNASAESTGNPAETTDDPGSTAATTAGPTTNDPDDGSESADETGPSDESTGDPSGDPTGDPTGDPPPANCTTATLLIGNPYWDGELGGSNPSGHGLLADPPLRSRHLADASGRLAVDTQSEIWIADATELVRVAGNETSEADRYRPTGECSDTRFLLAEGIVGLTDGRLVVADATGNGLVELSDPLAEDCTAAPIAGNPETTLAVDIDDVGAPGDVDGPGADARFLGVSRPVADDQNNVYVIDRGNLKIKRIADDAARTVTTLHHFTDGGNPLAMTALDGVLYITGTNGVDDTVWAIDTETGEFDTLFQGLGLFDEIDPGDPVLMHSLANDGVDLLVGSHEGYILRLSTDAFALGAIAGYGPVIDYPSDLPIDGPIPVGELPIDSYSINDGSVLRLGDDILVANVADGTGYHVWAIHCE
jgi:hypothetical protein